MTGRKTTSTLPNPPNTGNDAGTKRPKSSKRHKADDAATPSSSDNTGKKKRKKKTTTANQDCESENEPVQVIRAPKQRRGKPITSTQGVFKNRPLLDVVIYALGARKTAARTAVAPLYSCSQEDIALWLQTCGPDKGLKIETHVIKSRIGTIQKTYIDPREPKLPCPHYSLCTFEDLRREWHGIVAAAFNDFTAFQKVRSAKEPLPTTFGSWYKSEREQIDMLPQYGARQEAVNQAEEAMEWNFERAAEGTSPISMLAPNSASNLVAVYNPRYNGLIMEPEAGIDPPTRFA